ncbi:MAG: FIST C-terminal domain-containing protein [Synergistaceae bacterium]|nr:FIST C-terminal domain-containing protein [Synergistaceae bacterium]
MIKALSAFTEEVDDIEQAIVDIEGQIGGYGELQGNTIGLLTCYSEFISSGVVRELCRALPFPVIGATTLGNIVSGSSGRILLTLLILTSDDVEFSTGLSEPLSCADEAPLREAYEGAVSKISGRPSFMLSFAPLLIPVGGDFFADAFSDISGGVPNFGMMPVDNNSDYRDAQVIFDGDAYRDRYAFALVSGNVSPRFFMASISTERVFSQKGVVTSSAGNQVKSLNGRPVIEYLESLGLKRSEDGGIAGVNSFPFVLDYNDGTLPVVRVIFAITPEGYAVCGGDIPEGAILSVGRIDRDEVLSTTTRLVSDVLATEKPDCVLMFSCVGRYFIQGYDPTSEIRRVKELMEKACVPYQFTYSGGELCPVSSNTGERLTNRNHNDTFVMCVL